MKHKGKKILSLLLAVLMLLGLTVPSGILAPTAKAAAGETPAHTKSVTSNGDGTYKIELTVTGDADTTVETAANVNVIIVYDTSSSMTRYRANGGNTGPYRADSAEKVIYDFATALFEYQSETAPSNIQLTMAQFDHTADTVVNWTNSSNLSYIQSQLSSTGNANSRQLTYSSGTNWEDGMKEGQTLFNGSDKDPTFIIFITDGLPSQKTGTPDGTYYNEPGDHEQVLDCAQQAMTVARAMMTAGESANKTVEFFGIYAYGNGQDYLDDVVYYALKGEHRASETTDIVTNDGIENNYFNSTDTSALQEAIESIFQKIVNALGVSQVAIKDGTTSNVTASSGETTELVKVMEGTYQYWLSIPVVNNQFKRIDPVSGDEVTYTVADNGDGTCTVTWGASNSVTVDGKVSGGQLKYEWTEANALYDFAPPEAKLNGSSVDWTFPESYGALLDGVTYSVTFDVYPTQTTLDYIADLKNDPDAELPGDVGKYIHADGTFDTNTGATISWVDTRPGGGEKSDTFTPPTPLSADTVEMLTLTKAWENTLDNRRKEEVTLTVKRDTEEPYTVTLGHDNNENGEIDDEEWTDSVYISIGIMRGDDPENMEILASGHDFTFTEPKGLTYRWEMDVPVVRPMLINGEKTVLILVDEKHPAPSGATTYTLDGKQYYVGSTGEAALTATNYRRSSLNLTKTVTGTNPPADAVFPFTVNVVNSKAADDDPEDINGDAFVWVSVQDADGNLVKEEGVITGATAELDKDTGAVTGYYYAPSGSNITVNMKAGYNFRVNNLPTDSTYTITETTLPPGFHFNKAALSITDGTGEDSTFEGGKTSTGTIKSTNTEYTVTYTNDYAVVDVTVDKVWDDASNKFDMRPGNLDLTLNGLPAGTTTPTPTITKSGNTWTYTWSGLPKYGNDQEITYTVTEGTVPAGYSCTTTTVSSGKTITNTLDTATLTLTKSASGATVPDTAEFVISGTPTAAGQTFTDVTVTYADIKDGKYSLTVPVGTYKVVETETSAAVDGYTLVISGDNNTEKTAAKGGTAAFAITNTYTADTATLTLTKSASGTTVPDTAEFVISGTPTAADQTFSDVTVTYADIKDGKYSLTVPVGTYKVVETETSAAVNGYTLVISGDNNTEKTAAKGGTAAFAITNTYTADTATLTLTKSASGATVPDSAEFVISGTPTAADQTFTDVTVTYADIKDGKYSLTVPVGTYKVVETETSAAVDGYTLVVSGDNNTEKTAAKGGTVAFAISNTYAKDTATLKITKAVEGTTMPDTAQFVISGKPTAADLTFADVTVTYAEIKDGNYELTVPAGSYTVTETESSAKVDGYTLTVGGDNAEPKDLAKDSEVTFALTNTYEKDTAKLKITKTTTGGVDTPDTAEFVISGTPTAADQTFTDVKVTYADIKGGTYELEVPVGKYTVTETEGTATVTGYGLTVGGDNGVEKELKKGGEISFAITNTYESGKTNVEVKKVWNDNEDQDGLRPESIDVILLANGKESTTITLKEESGWTATLSVDEYADGKKIEYTADEPTVPTGYTKSVSGLTITNTHTTDTIDISGQKTWDDGNDQDGKRPDSITVNLLANGKKVDSKTVTAKDDWKYTFSGLQKNDNGKAITYTITEEAVEGYNTTVKGYDITNTYNPEEQTVTVNKVWDDNDNQDGVRPDSITVYLKQGETVCDTQILSESNGWEFTWEGLPKKQAGKDLTYTVEEDTDSLGDLYEAQEPEVSGSIFTITNTHEPEKLKPFTVTKVWNDDNNKTGKRPSSITVTLLADGKSAATATLTEAKGWTYTFENLPKYADGKEIKYTLKEATVSGYTSAVTGNTTDGFTVTNTVKDDTPPSPPPVIRIEIVKVWEDDSNASGTRTETVEVTLLKGGVKNLTRNLGDSNEWKYEGYVEAGYDYKVVETPVEGYESIVTQSPIPGGIRFTVVNKLTKTPELNTKDHVAYIVGYPDGTVRPGKEITRAEVATIFFRLLTEEARDKYWSQTNPYPDVKLDDWFNNAISTLTNMGIINGYEDGTFRPNNPITRAELTKMAVSFFSSADQYFGKTPSFSDVPADAWYTRFIAAAEALGLINGYPDGTFRPTNYITRAETCTIVNRTLGRGPHKDHLLPYAEMINWPDNTPDAWYYAQIQEASNSHDYDWITEQIENTTVEQWLAKLPERDWVALEQIWSNSHSAPGGEVMG